MSFEHVGFIINKWNVFELTLEGVSVFKMALDYINIKFQFGYDLGGRVMLINPFVERILILKGQAINTSVFEEAEVVE